MQDLQLRINELRREDRYNRFAQAFNFTTQAGSAAAQLNVAGLVGSFVELVFLPSHLVETTTHQRRALDLLSRWRYEALETPQAWDPPELAERRARQRKALADLQPYETHLRQKLETLHRADARAAARWSLDRGDPRSAYNMIVSSAPDETAGTEFEDLARRAAAALSNENRRRLASLQGPAQVHEAAAARLVRVVMASGQNRQAALLAQDVAATAQASLRDDAALVVALGDPSLLDAKDRRLLQHDDGNAARFYRQLLESPTSNWRTRLEMAESRKGTERLRFIFLGLQPRRQPPKAATARKRAYNLATAVGVLWPVQWIFRTGLSQWRPVPSEAPWRDTAADILRRQIADGHNDEAMRELAEKLAESYEREKRYDDARRYLEMADAPVERLAKLDRKEARHLWKTAKSNNSIPIEAQQLGRISRRFPDSPEAGKATRRLESLEQEIGGPPEKLLLSIPRAALRKESAWFRKLPVFNIEPTSIDGNRRNGEITPEGLHLFQTNPLRLAWRVKLLDASIETRSRKLSQQEYRQLMTALESVTANARRSERAADLFERLAAPFELEASAGPGGIDARPRLQTIGLPPEQVLLYQ